MKKFTELKSRKHMITLVCLLVGMLVLTSAVYANSDDAKGYTNLKNALKQTMFDEDNLSAQASFKITIDDTALTTVDATYKMDGNDSAATNREKGGDAANSFESYIKDGVHYSYYPDANWYSSYESTASDRMDMDDPTVQKSVRFMELLADTMVGDLKNNVVYTGGEDGAKNYSVNISGTQVPEVVNAGLSLMFTSYNNASVSYDAPDCFVTYENYMTALAEFYEQETGEEWDMDAYYEGDDSLYDIEMKFGEEYQSIIDEKGAGVLYVKADGTYDYYPTYEEYKDEHHTMLSGDEIASLMGDDPYIDSVHCDFSIDEEGRLTAITLDATMAGEDAEGQAHTAGMYLSTKISDYGTTSITLPDFSGVEKREW